jgi:hypothetical protein
MARYLLGTQCLMDVAKSIGLPPQRWFETAAKRGIDRSDVFISAVSPMILRTAFETAAKRSADAATKANYAAIRKNTDILTGRLVSAGSVVPMTKEIADRWGELLELKLTYENKTGEVAEYKFPEKLVFATAMVGIDGVPFSLVEKSQQAHGALAALGLLVEDPYQLDYEEVER